MGCLGKQVGLSLVTVAPVDRDDGAVDRLDHGGQVAVVDAAGVDLAGEFVEQRYPGQAPGRPGRGRGA